MFMFVAVKVYDPVITQNT